MSKIKTQRHNFFDMEFWDYAKANAKTKRKMQTKMMMQMLENDNQDYVRPKSEARRKAQDSQKPRFRSRRAARQRHCGGVEPFARDHNERTQGSGRGQQGLHRCDA